MLQVLFEDNHIIVVLKPHNIPTQGDLSGDVDMLTIVKNYLIEKHNKPGDAYVGLVHRLDRPTGGVMVFAKTSKAAARLSESIKSRDVEKVYLAVVEGTIRSKRATLVNYLKKNAKTNTVVIAPETVEGAKRAELDYEVLDTADNLNFVKINLVTGRSHQIRVQFKNINCPVVNDLKYGKKAQSGKYMALFAYMLKFKHPITGMDHTFKAYPDLTDYPWNLFATSATFN